MALVGRSTPEFLFTWLGLVQLGYSVLLLAPQLEPDAIAHLCKEGDAKKLVYDHFCTPLAQQSRAKMSTEYPLGIYRLPDAAAYKAYEDNAAYHAYLQQTCRLPGSPLWEVHGLDTAYFHHTSGTSSGLPKLLPVSHHMAIGALPALNHDASANATFSTTPLYHGGVADCFRAWAAASMIWLFPGDVPITASTIEQCIWGAADAANAKLAPEPVYFSCVPQVLAGLAQSVTGMVILRRMKMVGVGGAAMAEGLASRLVNEDVRLLSRYGSTECGFLLSSDRSYATDKDWQYLRHNPMISNLTFEPREDGLSELVVLSTWPALAKHNRADGSYATADLFEPHSKTPHAWRYHSRADAQMILSTGKKFDPAPVEDSIRECQLLDDILVFGNHRPFPGALLFRSNLAHGMDDKAMLDDLWPLVDKKNAQSPSHARLNRSMLIVMPTSSPGPLKSSKGTTLRRQAETKYDAEISEAYANERYFNASQSKNDEDGLLLSEQDDKIPNAVFNIVRSVIGGNEQILEDDNLYDVGVDSSACIRIRARIQAKLIPPFRPQLPLDVVYDCGTITKLSDFILDFRRGIGQKSEDEVKLMNSLVEKYGNWPPRQKNRKCSHTSSANQPTLFPSSNRVVLITGVTGALGTHILSQLWFQSPSCEIHCLIRASSKEAARGRVSKSLAQRQLPPLDEHSRTTHFHPCKLSQEGLGLHEEVFDDLANRVTLVIHAAWAVDFRLRLPSFVKDHIAGLHNLINFTLTSCRRTPPRFLFCSSTASQLDSSSKMTVPEAISHNPHQPSELGYSRSKWVAEYICEQAHIKTHLDGRIHVLRIGQLCGDSKRGVWNVTEAWPRMLSSSTVTGSLPDIKNERLSWLPVDVAARAVLEIAESEQPSKTVEEKDDPRMEGPKTRLVHPCHVYNLVNPSTTPTWSDLLRWLQNLSPEIEIVPPAIWVARLESLQGAAAEHPALKLLGLWKKSYGGGSTNTEPADVLFEMEETRKAAPTMRDIAPIGEEHFRRMWGWINREMMIKKAPAGSSG